MLHDRFRQLLLPTIVVTVVGSLWVAAWSQALEAQAKMGFPAPSAELQNPTPTADESAAQSDSLHKVFLKNDEVVSVR